MLHEEKNNFHTHQNYDHNIYIYICKIWIHQNLKSFHWKILLSGSKDRYGLEQRTIIYNIQVTQNSKEKKTRNPIRKWREDINRQLTEKNIWVANKHMKRCSTSLPFMEIKRRPWWYITTHPSEQLKLNIDDR